MVGKVNATDKDQAGTLHVKIRYSLKTGLDLFAIDPGTGVITTATNTLDREVNEFPVIVKRRSYNRRISVSRLTATLCVVSL